MSKFVKFGLISQALTLNIKLLINADEERKKIDNRLRREPKDN